MRLPVLIAAAVSVASLGAAPVRAADTDPRQFLTKAIEGDNSEIELGRLAERKGASAEVRQFGATLVKDHSASREQVVKVASSFGVQPTKELQSAAKAELPKLEKLNGKAFDREFARYMVHDHEQDIDDFSKAARSGEPKVARLAEQTLPVLHKHLTMGSDIRKKEG